MLNNLAEAMKALDGKEKTCPDFSLVDVPAVSWALHCTHAVPLLPRPFFYGILRDNQLANPRHAPCLPLRAARAFGSPARAKRLSNALPCHEHI